MVYLATKKSNQFLVSAQVASEPRISILNFLFSPCETMSNCSQNCWIDWNSAMLCFNPFASEAVYTCNFFRPPVGQRVNTHSVLESFFRKPCQHATRGCDKRWMTCIHAGVSRSPREHASVPPDKRHCHQWMSSLFCGFLPNPFIHDLFCWSSRHKFVKTDL